VLCVVAILLGVVFFFIHQYSSKSATGASLATSGQSALLSAQTQTAVLRCFENTTSAQVGPICTTATTDAAAENPLSRTVVISDSVVSANNIGNTPVETANKPSSDISVVAQKNSVSTQTTSADKNPSANVSTPIVPPVNSTSSSSPADRAPSQQIYTITATADAHGTISPPGTVTVNAGSSQTYALIPNVGYQINTVTIDGFSVTPAGTYVFAKIGANHAISVTFISMVAYIPSGTSPSDLGTDTGSPTTPPSGPSSGTPSSGSGESSSDTPPSNNNTSPADSPAVSAFSITASSGTNGSISPSGTTMVTAGDLQTYTFTPNSGYQVNSVTIDGVNQGALPAYTFFSVMTNHALSVTFIPASQSSSNQQSSSSGSSGSGSSSAGGGSDSSSGNNDSSSGNSGSGSGGASAGGLIAYYPLDGNGHDASGNGYDATLIHSPLFTAGEFGRAVEFSTAGAKYVLLPSILNYPAVATTSYALTVSLWFKSTTGDCPLYYEDNTGIAGIRLGTDDKIYASVFDHGSGTDELVTSGTYTDGKWHHVVDTYDGGTETLYVDGELVGSQSGVSELGITGDPSARLGMGIVCGWPHGSCAYHWLDNGAIDDVRFYNRALSAAEVMQLYLGN